LSRGEVRAAPPGVSARSSLVGVSSFAEPARQGSEIPSRGTVSSRLRIQALDRVPDAEGRRAGKTLLEPQDVGVGSRAIGHSIAGFTRQYGDQFVKRRVPLAGAYSNPH